MERLLMKTLTTWKRGKRKNPLVLYGPRHVGKTYLILDFARRNYGDIFVCRPGREKKQAAVFKKDRDPKRIIRELEALTNQRITPGETLLFIDEIHECHEALASLENFSDEAPEYDVIAASSLLALTISQEDFSFPFEKVFTLKLPPMSFKEFLLAAGQRRLVDEIENSYRFNFPVFGQLHETALEFYRTYLQTGGMPACVDAWLRQKDFSFVQKLQEEIRDSYLEEMANYATPYKTFRTAAVYRSIPDQLKKENKKFMYTLLQEGARAKSYEFSLDWLRKSGIVICSQKVREGKRPLMAYRDLQSVKLYHGDVGILTGTGGWEKSYFLSDSEEKSEIRKAVAENYVAQELSATGHVPYYWESEGKAEIDFVIQQRDSVLPISCKTSRSSKGKSFSVFLSKYALPLGIEISEKNFALEGNIRTIPLYAAFCI